LKFKHPDLEHAKLLRSKADELTKPIQRPTPSHLSKNAPSLPGLDHADMARSCRRSVSLTYQEICYVVIQAKGLSFSTILGKISWVCPKGGATSLPARMETQTWAILTAVSSGTN